MEETNFIDGLLEFLKQSPTPFHAVDNIHEIITAMISTTTTADAEN